MNEHKIYNSGKFITTSKKLLVINKYTGMAYSTTYQADEKTLNKAIDAAVKIKNKCKELSSLEKYTALKFISDQLLKDKKRLAEVLCIESGKPILYASAEIERAAQTFLIAAEESKRFPGEVLSLDWTPNGKNKEGLVRYFPVGIVAGISPFNFPLNLAVHKIAPAIAVGCPIILKPASTTPLSNLQK